MITKEQAVGAHYRQEFYSYFRGKVQRARVNGMAQTWKRDPNRWRLPMKYGLSQCFDIDPHNAGQWFATVEEAETYGNTPH